jgi:hypothetical protein
MRLSFFAKTVAAAAGLGLAGYFVAAANFALPIYEIGTPPRPDPYGLYQYRGAIHVHTTHSSDAKGSVSDVVVAAKNNDLDFVIVTDHNNLSAKKEEGYKEGLLFLAGSEVSTDHGHFLALGLSDELSDGDRRGGDYFAASSKLGGFNVLAHAFGGNNPWRRLEAGGFDGVEVMNLKEMFEEKAAFPFVSLALAAVAYPASPEYAMYLMYSRPDSALAFLDRALEKKRLTITCGADAHGFPDYSLVLGRCVNHVLSPERMNGRFDHDAPLVMDAIRDGRVFAAADAIARADGFAFSCGRHGASKDRTLKVSLNGFPRPDLVSAAVYWNGQKVGGRDGLREEWKAPVPGTGAVRIEVSLSVPTLLRYHTTVPWIHAVACGE